MFWPQIAFCQLFFFQISWRNTTTADFRCQHELIITFLDKNMTAICCHLRLMVKPQVPCQWWLAPELKPKLGSTGCFSTTSENAVENGRFHLSLWSFRAFRCWSWSLDFVLDEAGETEILGKKTNMKKTRSSSILHNLIHLHFHFPLVNVIMYLAISTLITRFSYYSLVFFFVFPSSTSSC